MITTCIQHPPKQNIAILREDYLKICDNQIAPALLLNFFEYWHNIRLRTIQKNKEANDIAEKHGDERTQSENLYLFYTAKQLHNGLMGLVGKQAIQKGLKLLIEKKYISIHKNPNPRYAFDATKHFLLHVDMINQALSNLPDWANAFDQNGKTVYPKWDDGLPKMGTISPKTTPKTTPEDPDNNNTSLKKSSFRKNNTVLGADGSKNSLIAFFKKCLSSELSEEKKDAVSVLLKTVQDSELTPAPLLLHCLNLLFHHGKAKETSGRLRKIKIRLKTFTGVEIMLAALKMRFDKFMCGDNPKGKIYFSIDVLIRSDEQVDKWLNREVVNKFEYESEPMPAYTQDFNAQ